MGGLQLNYIITFISKNTANIIFTVLCLLFFFYTWLYEQIAALAAIQALGINSLITFTLKAEQNAKKKDNFPRQYNIYRCIFCLNNKQIK